MTQFSHKLYDCKPDADVPERYRFLNILLKYSAAFALGALFLSCLSFIQKSIAGFDPLVLKSYGVPVLFGGASGVTLMAYITKIRRLNKKLRERVIRLESILPICSVCKRIRKPDADPDDPASWEQMESYISNKTDTVFSHGLCPECNRKYESGILESQFT